MFIQTKQMTNIFIIYINTKTLHMLELNIDNSHILHFSTSAGHIIRASINLHQLSACAESDFLIESLHFEEVAFYKSLKFEKRKKTFLIGRYCAKEAIISLFPDIDKQYICITNGLLGHPVVLSPQSNIQISISHSSDLGIALAFPELSPMGIDIEKINNQHIDILSNITAEEVEFNEILMLQEDIFYTLLWSSKESLSKVLKTGLYINMELYKVQNIKKENEHYIITYSNFKQYTTIAFILSDYICALTYPKNINIISNIDAIKNNLISPNKINT